MPRVLLPHALHSIASWRYYGVYVCNLATNIFSRQSAVGRAVRLSPDLAALGAILGREYRALAGLENKLQAAGGRFNITYETLQDKKECSKIAGILREFPQVFHRICEAAGQHL